MIEYEKGNDIPPRLARAGESLVLRHTKKGTDIRMTLVSADKLDEFVYLPDGAVFSTELTGAIRRRVGVSGGRITGQFKTNQYLDPEHGYGDAFRFHEGQGAFPLELFREGTALVVVSVPEEQEALQEAA